MLDIDGCVGCVVWESSSFCPGGQHIHFMFFIQFRKVWGVEPVVTHQTSWLGSTGVYVIHQSGA